MRFCSSHYASLVERRSLPTTAVGSIGPIARTFSPPQNVSMTFAVLSLITRLLIECSQRFNHFVEAHRTFAPWHSPESWSRFDRTSIRRPRRKDRALFVQCEIGIG